jgi:hypothetical protein
MKRDIAKDLYKFYRSGFKNLKIQINPMRTESGILIHNPYNLFCLR